MRLETDRLIIKPLGMENLDAYAAMVADPEVVRFLNEGIPRTREYATKYLEDLVNILKGKGFTRYGVFDKKTNCLLGHCGYKDIEGRIDIGWTYVRAAWGRGIGTEAAKAVLAYGFDNLEFDCVTARTDPANLGSVGVMRSVGMKEYDRFIWHLEDDSDHAGYPIVEYAVTVDDWRSHN